MTTGMYGYWIPDPTICYESGCSKQIDFSKGPSSWDSQRRCSQCHERHVKDMQTYQTLQRANARVRR